MGFKDIDEEIVKRGRGHISDGQQVKYYITRNEDLDVENPPILSDKDITDKFKKASVYKSYVCFSSLVSMIQNYRSDFKKDPNIMYYKEESAKRLNKKEKESWLDLVNETGMVPKHVDHKVIGKWVPIVLDKKLTHAQAYIELSTIRDLKEYPDLVKGVLHLVHDCGMNFFAAFMTMSKISATATGHHITNKGVGYGEKPGYKNVKVPVNIAVAIPWLIRDYSKYDSTTLLSEKRHSVGSSNCINSIATSFKSEYNLSVEDMFHENIEKAIESKKVSEVKSLLKEVNDGK